MLHHWPQANANPTKTTTGMAYHLLLIEILVMINQQDTPSFLFPRTPKITTTLYRAIIRGVTATEKLVL
jgi:hypothetical protein